MAYLAFDIAEEKLFLVLETKGSWALDLNGVVWFKSPGVGSVISLSPCDRYRLGSRSRRCIPPIWGGGQEVTGRPLCLTE